MSRILRATLMASASASARVVLVVDDFDDSRELYAAALADEGFTVVEARNGQEALDCFDEVRPVLVVMDLAMPIVDGWEATRRLKADPQTAETVIIALTGHATKSGLDSARDAGADAVLGKPCLPNELIAVVHSLLR